MKENPSTSEAKSVPSAWENLSPQDQKKVMRFLSLPQQAARMYKEFRAYVTYTTVPQFQKKRGEIRKDFFEKTGLTNLQNLPPAEHAKATERILPKYQKALRSWKIYRAGINNTANPTLRQAELEKIYSKFSAPLRPMAEGVSNPRADPQPNEATEGLHPNASARTYNAVAKDPDARPEVLLEIAKKKVTSSILDSLVKNPRVNAQTLLEVARKPETLAGTLAQIAEHEKADSIILAEVARHHQCTHLTSVGILVNKQTTPEVLEAILQNKNVTDPLIAAILKHPQSNAESVLDFVRHPHAGNSTCAAVLADPRANTAARLAVAWHPQAQDSTLAALLADPRADAEDLMAVASHSNAGDSTLTAVVNDSRSDVKVLIAATVNKNTKPATFKHICNRAEILLPGRSTELINFLKTEKNKLLRETGGLASKIATKVTPYWFPTSAKFEAYSKSSETYKPSFAYSLTKGGQAAFQKSILSSETQATESPKRRPSISTSR